MSYQLNLKASYNAALQTYSVCHDGTNLFVGTTSGTGSELRKLSFSGSAFTSIADINFALAVSSLATDGAYLYCVCPSNYTLYAINKTTLATINSIVLPTTSTFNSIVCSPAGYIFSGTQDGWLRAYSFDGVNFALRGSYLFPDANASCLKVLTDGTYIYALMIASGASMSRCDAFTFDGTNFTFVASTPNMFASSYVITMATDGSYFYFGRTSVNNPDLLSYSFDGTWHAVQSGNLIVANAESIECDGSYIYITEQANRVGIYKHSPSTGFSFFSSYNDTGISGATYRRNLICCSGGYAFYCSNTNVKALRVDLVASFTVDVLAGNISIPRNFTAI